MFLLLSPESQHLGLGFNEVNGNCALERSPKKTFLEKPTSALIWR
jgi:hypothetical protein